MGIKGEEKTFRVLSSLNRLESDWVSRNEWFWHKFIENFKTYKKITEKKKEKFLASKPWIINNKILAHRASILLYMAQIGFKGGEKAWKKSKQL